MKQTRRFVLKLSQRAISAHMTIRKISHGRWIHLLSLFHCFIAVVAIHSSSGRRNFTLTSRRLKQVQNLETLVKSASEGLSKLSQAHSGAISIMSYINISFRFDAQSRRENEEV